MNASPAISIDEYLIRKQELAAALAAAWRDLQSASTAKLADALANTQAKIDALNALDDEMLRSSGRAPDEFRDWLRDEIEAAGEDARERRRRIKSSLQAAAQFCTAANAATSEKKDELGRQIAALQSEKHGRSPRSRPKFDSRG